MDDYLPLSMLNQLEYCERRFFLMHVRGEMEVNVHVLQGTLLHEQAHQPHVEKEGELVRYHKVYLWSDTLGVAGFADVVEEFIQDGQRVLLPIEYKKGRMGLWLNDHLQLCAQAICLEERSGVSIQRGYIFYFGSKRRQEVMITPALREQTALTIHRARALIAAGRLPPPLENYKKCRDCSLEPICLPREVRKLTKG